MFDFQCGCKEPWQQKLRPQGKHVPRLLLQKVNIKLADLSGLPQKSLQIVLQPFRYPSVVVIKSVIQFNSAEVSTDAELNLCRK